MSRETGLPNHPFFEAAQNGLILVPHRGGNLAGMDRQNTPEAFESAVAAGLDYAETDAISTADDISVIFHGSEDLPKELRNGYPTSEEIEKLNHYEVIKKLGRALLRTDELLSNYPELNLFIEPKTDRAVVPLARAIQLQNAEDRVNVGSFRYRRTQRVAEILGKKISTSFFKYRGFQVHQPGVTLVRAMNSNGFNILQVPHDMVGESELDKYKSMGLWVISWAKMGSRDDPRKYDTPAYIERAFTMGFDGVISDHTKELSAIKNGSAG